MNPNEGFERYQGGKGDDEGAPKHPRELMNDADVPADEIADVRLNPEEALIAREEGKEVPEIEDPPHAIAAEDADSGEPEYPWERAENADKAGVALTMPELDADPGLPSHSGSSQIMPIPESAWKGLKRHLGRSVGPRGTESKSKNKRRGA